MIQNESIDPNGRHVYYVAMQITFLTCNFQNVERNFHCDVVHVPPFGSLASLSIAMAFSRQRPIAQLIIILLMVLVPLILLVILPFSPLILLIILHYPLLILVVILSTEQLLNGLKHNDTIVRWSAAKGYASLSLLHGLFST